MCATIANLLTVTCDPSLLTVTWAPLMLGFAGRCILGVWAGKTEVPSSTLLWGLCSCAVLLAVTIDQAALLAATQRLLLQAVCSTLTTILNFALSIMLVRRFGAIGVLLSLCIILPQTWEVRRLLRGRYLRAKTEEEDSIKEVLSGRVLDNPTFGFRRVIQCPKGV